MSSDLMSANKVLATLESYNHAMRHGDVQSQLDFYSETWSSGSGRTKADVKRALTQSVHIKDNQSKSFELGEAKVRFEDGRALVEPVTLRSPTGGGIFRFTFELDGEDKWRCTSFGIASGDESMAVNARTHREHLLNDPHRPTYHFVVPEGIAMPFDPNGAIFWKGRYHLFYIFQDSRLGKRSDHWGHASTIDLMHWRHHPLGLVEGMYSGNCFLNKDGVPTICYHQNGTGNAIAVATDEDLNKWQKLDSNPITPKAIPEQFADRGYKSWDPFGWLENDTYYAIFGGNRPAVVKSHELNGEWEYVGDLLAHSVEGVALDEDVSCADFFRLGDKYVLLCISHRLGCRYYTGTWHNELFHPEKHGSMSWTDNSFFAPESLVDDQGRRIMWSWVMDEPRFGIRSVYGWSGTMGLPRVLTLNSDGLIEIDVPDELKRLRYNEVTKPDAVVSAGEQFVLDPSAGNCIELEVEMKSASAMRYGVNVCVSPDGTEKTSIYYDAENSSVAIDTTQSGPVGTPKDVEAGPLELAKGEPVRLRIFLDKSIVELFANSKQAVMRRIYPSQADSLGIELFAEGGDVEVSNFRYWQIAASNPY